MRQPRAGLGLAHEAVEVFGAVDVRPDGLHRHDALQGRVEGLVDLAHASASQDRFNLEATDLFRQRGRSHAHSDLEQAFPT